LKELKRVERSLYSVRAGRGSKSLVSGVEFEGGAMYLQILSAEYSYHKYGPRALFVIEVNGGFSERVQSREKISILL
jgi:hypothetical protein